MHVRFVYDISFNSDNGIFVTILFAFSYSGLEFWMYIILQEMVRTI
jgi:hypothetical protein